MSYIWTPENRFKIWFDIERHALRAQVNLGQAPKKAIADVERAGKHAIKKIVDTKAIDKIEAKTKHDVIAFLTNLASQVGPSSRFVHQGLTSSDVLDTCLSVQMTQSTDILLKDLEALLKALRKRAKQHKNTLCVGRSHGIHAEPTTFGLKLAGYYEEFHRNKKRLLLARDEISVCAISGPVGTYSSVDPRVEKYVAKCLNLSPEKVSTQVIPRDRHAAWFSTLGIIASSIERLATEIRHLQRTEVREVEEFFDVGQKGSSAMPHKRNPILSENITGLSRIVRATVNPALENVSLWHERDISHSSVERVFAPDASIALDFALVRLTNIVDKLLVYPKNMRLNIDRLGGLIHSQKIMLTLIESGLSREKAYKLVQKNAMKVLDSDKNFQSHLLDDKEIVDRIDIDSLKKLFDSHAYVENIDFIFNRIFPPTKNKKLTKK
tara:strand:- start:107651 stop:108964 length:1314 start_codon:yes stop_codon:yes gene_type:complete